MIRAVLFDRDGTLIADAPGRPRDITPMPHAADTLRRLRERGMKIGVVTNQPAIAQGTIGSADLQNAHDRIGTLIGAIDGWFVCPHAAAEGCACRKPRPGLIHSALRAFGVEPHECVVVGDIGSDVQAAHNAGAHAILVPTPVTLHEEIARAPLVCANLQQAADCILAWEQIPA